MGAPFALWYNCFIFLTLYKARQMRHTARLLGRRLCLPERGIEMYQQKTLPTNTPPLAVIEAVEAEQKRKDGIALLAIFKKATGEAPVVWGEKQIGFGSYKYKYASGHKGEFYSTGFAVSNSKLHLYLDLYTPGAESNLARLGKHTHGKSCVYINRLADIDIAVLAAMIQATIENAQKITAEV